MSGSPQAGPAFERRLGRLLTAVTYVAVGLLTIGVVLMLLAGISPLAVGPPFDPAQLVPELAPRPEAVHNSAPFPLISSKPRRAQEFPA